MEASQDRIPRRSEEAGAQVQREPGGFLKKYVGTVIRVSKDDPSNLSYLRAGYSCPQETGFYWVHAEDTAKIGAYSDRATSVLLCGHCIKVLKGKR